MKKKKKEDRWNATPIKKDNYLSTPITKMPHFKTIWS